MNSKFSCGGLAITLVMVLAAQARAQESIAPKGAVEPISADAATSRVGADIIVTARRREEALKDVPVAVTAISSEQIRRADLSSLEKVAAITPNLSIGRASNGSGTQITLRGVGSSWSSIGIEQSVAVVVDNSYYGQGRIIQEGFFDLSRIEILRGPQALFFGKNATAGVISIVTADPGNRPEFRMSAGYEFASHQIQGDAIASTPLTDTLGVRVAVRGSKMYQGYFRNVSSPQAYPTVDAANFALPAENHIAGVPGEDQPQERELLGRITLRWAPQDDLTFTWKTSGTSNDTNNSSWNYVAFNCPSGSSALNPQVRCTRSFVSHQNEIPADIAENLRFARDDGRLYNRYRSVSSTLNARYAPSDVTFEFVGNYQWNNNRFACDCDFQSEAGAANVWATENSTWRAYSSELRATTTFAGPLNALVGLYYQNSRRTFEQPVIFAGLSNSAASAENRYLAYAKASHTNGETLAAYGQLIWDISSQLQLTAGARYTHETKKSSFVQYYVNPALGFFRSPNSPDGLGVISADQTFNDLSPDITVRFRPTQNLMFYAAYREGYKSGGFSNSAINSALSSNPTADFIFGPERARGFEAGTRVTVGDGQLQLGLTGYAYKYSNFQVDFINSVIFAYQTLPANVRTKGLEGDFQFRPRELSGLTVSGSVGYNRAQYDNFIGPCYGGQTVIEGCRLQFAVSQNGGSGGFTRQNLNGVPLSMAPKWVGSLGIDYSVAITTKLDMGFNVSARYSGAYLSSGFGAPQSRQARYVQLDGGLRFGPSDASWEIALIGRNLTNRFYVTGVVDGPNTGSGTGTPGGIHSDQLGFAAMPRTVQLRTSIRF